MSDIHIPVLTIRQPWADATTLGFSDVINQRGNTQHRGWILISAARDISHDAPSWVACCPGKRHTGAIVGAVHIDDVTLDSQSPWAQPYRWHWLLDRNKSIQFENVIMHRGRKGLAIVSHSVTRWIDTATWQNIIADSIDTSWHRDR